MDNMEKHSRRSIRLKGWDYSSEGAYFVTICTQNKVSIFGDIVDGSIKLNEIGKMVNRWWIELVQKFKNIKLDEYIIMPNHLHGIIFIVGADLSVCPESDLSVCPESDLSVCPANQNKKGEHIGSPLHKMIQWFKTMTTNEYIRGVKENMWKPYDGRLWQRNYYEHIIRNEDELNLIRQYIQENPLKWNDDPENHENKTSTGRSACLPGKSNTYE